MLLLNARGFGLGRALLHARVVGDVFGDLHEGLLLLGRLVGRQRLDVVVLRIALAVAGEHPIRIRQGHALIIVHRRRHLTDSPRLLNLSKPKLLLVKDIFRVPRDAAHAFLWLQVQLCLNTVLALIGLLNRLVVQFSTLRFVILRRVVLIELFESLDLFLVEEQEVVTIAHVRPLLENHGLGRNVQPLRHLNIIGLLRLVLLDLLCLGSMVLQRLCRFLGRRFDFLNDITFQNNLLGCAFIFGADYRRVSFLALLSQNLLVHRDFLGAWLRERHAVDWGLAALIGLVHLLTAPIFFNLRLLFGFGHEIEAIFHTGPLLLDDLVL